MQEAFRGLAVEENRARAADPVLAADVRAREAEVLAEEVHEELARLAASRVRDAVHRDADRDGIRHGRL